MNTAIEYSLKEALDNASRRRPGFRALLIREINRNPTRDVWDTMAKCKELWTDVLVIGGSTWPLSALAIELGVSPLEAADRYWSIEHGDITLDRLRLMGKRYPIRGTNRTARMGATGWESATPRGRWVPMSHAGLDVPPGVDVARGRK